MYCLNACMTCGGIGFEGEEPNKLTVVINNSEGMAEAMIIGCHVREIIAYPLKRFGHSGELLPLLLQPHFSPKSLKHFFFYIITDLSFEVWPLQTF